MKTLISIMTFTAILLISGCYTDSTKDTDDESAEQSTAPASHPASNRY